MALAIAMASSKPRSAIASAAACHRMHAIPIHRGQFERRQLGGNLADNFDALLVEPPVGRRAAVMQITASNSSGSRRRNRTLIQRSASAIATVPRPMRSAAAIRLIDVRNCQPKSLEKMVFTRADRGQAPASF